MAARDGLISGLRYDRSWPKRKAECNISSVFDVRFTPVSGRRGGRVLILTSSERGEIGSIETFGLAVKPHNDPVNTAQAEIYIDNLSYTGPTEVTIDIKPGSDPNGVNPRSIGDIPVAVLGSVDFDVMQVDSSVVAFGPDGASPVRNGHFEDVNDDDFVDLVLHFKTQDTGIACGDTEATLTGETFGGNPIAGTDAVKTAGCK